MANFVGDLSSAYVSSAALYGSTTGVTTNGTGGTTIDFVSNVGNIISATLVVGTVTGTSPTLDVKIQESTTGTGAWTDVTGGAFTQVTTSNQLQVLPFKPTKRYLQVSNTVGGTTPVFPATVVVVGPLTTAPVNVGGFNNTAAAGNA